MDFYVTSPKRHGQLIFPSELQEKKVKQQKNISILESLNGFHVMDLTQKNEKLEVKFNKMEWMVVGISSYFFFFLIIFPLSPTHSVSHLSAIILGFVC